MVRQRENSNLPPLSTLKKTLMELLRRIEVFIALLTAITLAMLTVTLLILRNVQFGTNGQNLSFMLSPVTPHLLLILGLMGASIAISRGESLQIEFLNPFYSDHAKMIIRRIIAILGITFLGFYLFVIYTALQKDYRAIVAFVYMPLVAIILLKFTYAFFKKNAVEK